MLYHIPCPGCGITRATLLVFQGKFYDAITLNPNVILSIGFVFGYPLLVLLSLILRKHLIPFLYDYANNLLKKKLFLITFLIAELAIWINNFYHDI